MEQHHVEVGVGVMVFKDGNILLGKRIKSHGLNTYSMPGGHLEYMESFEECARREVMEETGIHIKNVRFNIVANEVHPNKHLTHIGLIADWEGGEVENLEPHKCAGWDWYGLQNLPEPLFSMTKLGIENLNSKIMYYDK